MRKESEFDQDFGSYLAPIRALPFVRRLDVHMKSRDLFDRGFDAEIVVRTRRRAFKLAAEFKRSYLDHATVNALIAQQVYARDRLNMPLLLLARYVPPPTGERLARAGINFVDAVGNVHLNLESDYYVFVVGRKEAKPQLAERRTTAGMVQVVFTLLSQENAVNWPVRKLAEIAGVGKTAAADARRRLTETGKLIESPTGLRIGNRKALQEDFVAGYEHILRSDLWVGTFRPVERDPDVLLRKIKEWADRAKTTWATTDLSRLYRGERITVFLTSLPENFELDLKLSTDEQGSVTLLRSFGTLFPWRIQGGTPIAHPLLIYAELLHEGEPKALEAAAHIREKYFAK